MSNPFESNNPGISFFDELTQAEETFIQNLAGLSYSTGDMLYYNGSSLTRLPIGSATNVLTVTGGIPAWSASAAGNVSKVGTPVDNQIGVWTGDGTIEGTTGLTYNGSNFLLTGDIGATGTRITKGWFTDLEVTNAIAGSITGNSATVTTNANLTGVVTSTGNATAIADAALSIGKTSGLQTALDAKANSAGSLTQFLGNTAWRVFYSDASGDITELALGADGTFLKSNGASLAPTFAVPAGSGDVSKVGTPVNNQVGVWTGDGTLEGDVDLTFDTTTNTLGVGLIGLDGRVQVHAIKSDASDGLLIEASDGTDVGVLGVGNTANVSWSGSHNFSVATQDTIAGFTGTGKTLGSLATATYPSLTELTYVKGVTSAIQTQLGTKAPTTSPTFATSITGSYLTASEILITDASKNIVSAPVATYPSLTELTYLKGVTSAIQTQFTGKQSTITFGTGVQTALGVNIGSAGAPVLFDGALGTPSSGTVTNLTGTASININGTVGATTPTTATFTTATINTSLLPDANDGAVLGAAGTAWSDLFLAEGGVINWDSSDATITQTGNVLAVAGADFQIATAGVGTNADSVPTLSSTSTFTNKTLTSPTLTTPSAFTTGGTITLAENTSIALDPAGSADGKFSGITVTAVAGYTQAFGDLVYLAVADSRWELADADALATSGNVALAMVVVAGTDGAACTLLLQGIIRADAKFPAMTVGATQYVGETAGAIQGTIPTGADNIIRTVGYALTADELYFNPSTDWQVTVA